MGVNKETHDVDVKAKVEELAKLPPIEYDQQREAAAKLLGVRVGTLDKEWEKRRGTAAEENSAHVVEEISPCEEAVNGSDLLDEIRKIYSDYCVMHECDRDVLTVAALGTYVFDAFSVFPKILIKSPEKRCGKTVTAEASEAICYRSMMASSISTSSIFRIIDAHHPTLIIDESDTFMKGNEEMRGVINSSHRRRNAFVIRTEKVGDEFIPRKFTTWSPMFIVGIGNQADTIEDRSIIIELRRKLTSEKVKKCPVDLFESLQQLRRKCLRWATDNLTALKLAEFELPDCGNDRAADNWFPVFAIAKAASKKWEDKIAGAYWKKNSIAEDEAIGVMLLSDVRDIFLAQNWTRMHSEDLVNQLTELEDRPWPEWRHGKPMTKASLGRLLKPFKIKSHQIKVIGINRYGYERSQFEDAWKRYLPEETANGPKETTLSPWDTPSQNATTLQPASQLRLRQFDNATGTQSVASLKSLKAKQDGACSAVAFSRGGIKDRGGDQDRIFEDF